MPITRIQRVASLRLPDPNFRPILPARAPRQRKGNLGRMIQRCVLTGVISALVMCAHATPPERPADRIYYGGDILTMAGSTPKYVERLAIRDGKIVYAGPAGGIGRYKGPATVAENLRGKCLIPGFYDAHGHFVSVGVQAISANLLPQPDGPVSSIAQLQKVMREHIATSPIVKKFGVAIGFNYDDSQLKEKRSPTAAELDEVSTKIPIVVIHQSGHLGAMNSVALKQAGITAASVNPPGGVILRKPGSKEPTGVLEETAFFVALFKVLPDFSESEKVEQVIAAQKIYAANGFTTIQEGRAEPEMLSTLKAGADGKNFFLDVVGFPALDTNGEKAIMPMSSTYKNRYRFGGVKLTFDGSPQGKTAYFTHPYHVAPTGQPKTYKGYPAFSNADAEKWVMIALKNRWDLLVHTNGDAAIDQLIQVVKKATAKYPLKGNRLVLIHGQYLRKDQVSQLKKLEIMPSLYPMHTFYWGDWHRQSVAGPARAENISPTGWLLAAGMKFTIHHDAPVTFPNSMRVLDSAVNRTTRSGYVIGPRQRISPYVALQAMTIWAAYQHQEENTKGSLQPGKLADLVVLDRNPLKVRRQSIVNIRVLQTLKEGKIVFQAGSGR